MPGPRTKQVLHDGRGCRIIPHNKDTSDDDNDDEDAEDNAEEDSSGEENDKLDNDQDSFFQN
ncbi:hypothetical protein VNI00_012085, partial [Paramarasmius palmivorus]